MKQHYKFVDHFIRDGSFQGICTWWPFIPKEIIPSDIILAKAMKSDHPIACSLFFFVGELSDDVRVTHDGTSQAPAHFSIVEEDVKRLELGVENLERHLKIRGLTLAVLALDHALGILQLELDDEVEACLVDFVIHDGQKCGIS
jgi:hypothetical protein